jgi:hypothetical protein
MRHTGLLRCCLLALLLVPMGCDDPAAPPDAVDESDLTFIRVAPDAPPVTDTVVTFWASKTEDREVQIRYASEGYVGKCLRFFVPAHAIQDQDSVKITIRLVNRAQFLFQFEPSGLKFDPAHPAILEVRYRWADPDLNGDGVVDQNDDTLAGSFGFWRQERPGDEWIRVETHRAEEDLEASTSVTGFTRYALATH